MFECSPSISIIQPRSGKDSCDAAVHDGEAEMVTIKQEQVAHPLTSTQATKAIDPELQYIILAFTCRMLCFMAVMLVSQLVRALTMPRHRYLGLAFAAKFVLQSTNFLMNYTCTGYLYGYYPLELLEAGRSLTAGAFKDMFFHRQEVAKTESMPGPVGC